MITHTLRSQDFIIILILLTRSLHPQKIKLAQALSQPSRQHFWDYQVRVHCTLIRPKMDRWREGGRPGWRITLDHKMECHGKKRKKNEYKEL